MCLRAVLKKELLINLMMSVINYTQPHFNVSVPIHSGADRCVQ